MCENVCAILSPHQITRFMGIHKQCIYFPLSNFFPFRFLLPSVRPIKSIWPSKPHDKMLFILVYYMEYFIAAHNSCFVYKFIQYFIYIKWEIYLHSVSYGETRGEDRNWWNRNRPFNDIFVEVEHREECIFLIESRYLMVYWLIDAWDGISRRM